MVSSRSESRSLHVQLPVYDKIFAEVPITETTASILANSNNISGANGNNSTILSLLANTSAQSSSSSTTNITLSNLLTSAASARALSAGQTVNMAGQRVVAKRLKMPNATAARMLSGNQQVATSLGNATVIAAASTNVPSTGTTINAQPVIRLSLSSLQNQVLLERIICVL